MGYLFIFTPCKCVDILDVDASGLPLIDSDRLPETDIQIKSIVLDGVEYEINITFPTTDDFLDYLNGFPLPTGELAGIWQLDGGLIRYTNPENFDTAEIMAILRTTRTVLRVGTPSYTWNGPTTNMNNGTVFSLPGLAGEEILQVNVAASAPLPDSESAGYKWNSGTTVLDLSGTGSAVQNDYIIIIHTQTS